MRTQVYKNRNCKNGGKLKKMGRNERHHFENNKDIMMMGHYATQKTLEHLNNHVLATSTTLQNF